MILKEWNGKAIQIREDGRINLNSMALACGRTVKHTENWLANENTKKLLEASKKEEVFAQTPSDQREFLIETAMGRGGGRWAIRPIAIAYAMDLSPDFYWQVCLWIDELFTKGTVSITNDPVSFLKHLKDQVPKTGQILCSDNRVHHLYFARAIKNIGRALYRQGQTYIDLHYANDHIEDYQEIVNVSQPLLPWDEEEGT